MQIQIKTFIFKNQLWCFWSIEKFQFLYDHLRFVYGCKYVIIHSHTSYVLLVSSDFARATKQPNMRLSDSFLVVDRIVTNKHVINNVEYHFKNDIGASNMGILILINVGISSTTWFHVSTFCSLILKQFSFLLSDDFLRHL